MRPTALFTSLATLLTLAACGPQTPPIEPSAALGPASAEPMASAAPSAEPKAAPPEDKPAPAAEASPAEALARDLLKSGGRRIGWSAGKKRFVVPIEMRAGGGRGLDLRYYDDDGQQREIQRVCQPGECEQNLDELVKELIPKLAARLGSEGYEAVSAVGWPSGREEMDIESINLKLRFERGKLSAVREKKPATPLRSLGGRSPKGDSLSALYPVPAQKLLGAFAQGDKVAYEFYVFKLP